MRSLKSVLRAVGHIKTAMPQLNETSVTIKGIRDMNLSKLLSEDVLLFDKMFEDLFPDCEEPEINMDDLQIALEDCMEDIGCELNETIVVKAIQLFEQLKVRHGVMIIGETMSGKSTIQKILEKAMNKLTVQQSDKYKGVKVETMNPKSIDENEFYGYMDDSMPPQWLWGVFSILLKTMIGEDQKYSRWLLMDGPVDTLWIESMNSLLDDSKVLTLNNGDRLPLSHNCKLLFEANDLDVASPATISRVGIIFMDVDELGYQPWIKHWVDAKEHVPFNEIGIKGEDYKQLLSEMVTKYLVKVMTTKNKVCKEMVKSSELACIRNFTRLYDFVFGQTKKAEDGDTGNFLAFIEKVFVFSLIWSVGATVSEVSRRELDLQIRDIEPMFPHANTVFEYWVNPDKQDFDAWDNLIQTTWRPQPNCAFYDIYVPTTDTVRYNELLKHLMKVDAHVMFVGTSGVGKTKRIESYLNVLNEPVEAFTINFSAGTTAPST